MMQQNSLHSGFSLVETLVAITILLIVIVGPLAIVSSAANSTMFSSDQVAAFLLAQEGAELAQKARDDYVIAKFNNSSAPDPWTTFTNTGGVFQRCYAATGCGLEITDTGALDTIRACTNNTNCQLHLLNDLEERSQFTHDTSLNNPSGFTRVITFQNTTTEEVRVVSRVTWYSGISRDAREVEVETYLFDVYGN
jgi:prepilin-type N-terminal cleavage/methylation domain-containing protein